MPAREYAMIVKESSYGVPMEDPVKGTDLWYLRLSGSNAFGMQSVPIIEDIMYGGGVATPACAFSDQEMCTGALTGELYAGPRSKLLMDWALTPVNTGRTAPWTTTDANYVMPVGDLASVSIYHAIQQNDSTYDLRRYSGVKVLSGSISASRQSPAATFSFQLQGIRDEVVDAEEFPAPAETDYPCGPYLFSHTSGKLKIATARTLYSSVQFSWTNAMSPQWFESKYLQLLKCCGRTSSLEVDLYMKKTPDDLTTLKALTALDAELSFDNTVNTLKIDMGLSNRFKGLVRDLPIDGVYSWKGTVQNYWDASAASDLVVSAT